MSFDARRVAEVLGLERRVRTVKELDDAVRAGLPLESLDSVVRRVAEDDSEARRIKDRIVPRATRYRRREQQRLKPAESERLERVARIVSLAEEVWESRADAREFLTTPQPALDDRLPLELAETDLGARQVEQLLMKLEHGLPV